MAKLYFSILKISLLLLLICSASGCVLVGGYSSGQGFWIWPGTIVLLVIGAALFFLMRRRR